MLHIAVINPKGLRTEEECTIDSCTIGKSDENRIILQGWTVGRKHATIHRRQDGVYVEDHGAASGTRVNGQRISGVYGPLKKGDEIGICDYVMAVLDIEEPAPAPVANPVTSAVASTPAPAAADRAAEADAAERKETTDALKHLHAQLIKQMDLRRVDVSRQTEDELRENTRVMLEEIVAADRTLPPHMDRAMLVKRVLDEVVGLGPLEDLVADESVSEIMVNNFEEIFI
ncbi:MAG TPA: FHA domain-containing protein, partial [Noviherbaspirillum sp.]|nr:FHA domain-containing protein [Noviherbaspirillum sp.]